MCSKLLFCLKQTSFIGKSPHIRSSWFILSRRNIHFQSILRRQQTNTCFYTHSIVSFCTQIKERKDEGTDLEDEYEGEEDEEYENEEEDDEYEYEYATDDEFEGENEDEAMHEDIDVIQSRTNSEISENFKTYSDNMMNDLFAHLPQDGRIEGKPIEHFISPLILKPLEVLEDEVHNKFSLMHNDMDELWKRAYKIPMENESELRDVIDLAFDKLNVYTSYVEHSFNLNHSPKHYLMRQLRVDHGNIVYVAIRKIMYFKYPEWVQSDNWATEEMQGETKRNFVLSHELGIGFKNEDNTSNEDIEDDNTNTFESEQVEEEEQEVAQ